MKPYYENSNGRLYLGDCLEIMPELEPVDLVLTDPPYNCGKDYGVYKDKLSDAEYTEFMLAAVKLSRAAAKNQFWIAPRYQLAMWLSLLPKSHLIVVRRSAMGPFRGGWSDQFEIALSIGKPSKCTPDLWENIRLKGEGYFFREETYGHPGYTPSPIMYKAVSLLSETSVLDPFMGTGTTGVACEKLGRKWIGIEISEAYCEISARRIEAENKQHKLFK